MSQQEISTTHNPISAWEKVAYILLFAAFIVARIPAVFTMGRFWAEEGTVFFANAWYLSWYKALFATYGGYTAICANLAAVLARYLVPLEYACYVSSTFALIIQILPAILLCTSKDQWLQDRKILIASLLLVASLPFSYEVWLSSIGSQCHLNLCVILILALEITVGLAALFRYTLLFLAPLSGPGAVILLPLFIARAVIERSKSRAIQATILGSASAVQIILSSHAYQRQLGIDVVLLINTMFVKHILEPLAGQTLSYQLTWSLHDLLVNGPTSITIALLTIAIFGFFGTAVWRAGNAPSMWFFLSGLILSTVSYFSAWGMQRSELPYAGYFARYVFAPQISFELALLCLSCVTLGWARSIARIIIVWILVIGLHDYFFVPTEFSTGASWPSQVRVWRKDSHHILEIWPAHWFVQLTPSPAK